MEQVGVITEQGDLGLGFDPLKGNDEKTYHEVKERQEKEDNENDCNKCHNL